MQKLYIDGNFLLICLFFAGLSLSLVWSNNPSLLKNQLIFFLVGFLFFFIFSQVSSNVLENLSNFFYLLSVLLLLLTLFNVEIRGANRWINIFDFRIQPSEIVKPFLIISFANFMDKTRKLNLTLFLQSVFYYLIPIIIIFLQPDLGNVSVYFLFLTGMLIANNLNFKIIFLFLLFLIIGSPFLWFLLRDYQRQRILSFINPQNDPQGIGYNAIQSMIAVGSGGFFGLGLGRGTQSHLRFLPENHTDFIFASLVEELGLFAAFILLFLYGYIFTKILHSAANSTKKFNYLISIGIFSQLLSQVFINIAMNIGLIPITGVTLPLISAGGSSLIATFIGLGIIASFRKEEKPLSLVIR